MLESLIIFFYKNHEPVTASLLYTLKSLDKICSELIVIGENIPKDISFYKTFKSLSDYPSLKDFEKIIAVNSTFYGPFNSFENIFEKMSEFDFWSLDNLFLQNKAFVVFKGAITKNIDFAKHLESQDLIEEFKKIGCSASLYNDDIYNIHKNIENYSYPIIHKEYFYKEEQKTYNYRLKFAYDYIKNNLNFDTNLIIEDLIAHKKAHLIPKNLHLNYLLQSDTAKSTTEHKIALIMFIHPESLVEECRNYAERLPENIDIIVVSTSDGVIKKCKSAFSSIKNKTEYRLKPNRGRDNTALLITCADVIKDYEFICFVHAKVSNHIKQKNYSDDFRNHCFNSLLYSKNYISNIISTFENNKFLGILAPFPPNFQPFVAIGYEWGKNLDNARKFIKDRIKSAIPLSEKNPICVFGNMFWFRGAALKTLVNTNFSFEDFPEEPLQNFDGLLTHTIERITPALAQIDGFYTSYVAPVEYGVLYLDNIMNDFKLIRKDYLDEKYEK